jgi:hypothetical protein
VALAFERGHEIVLWHDAGHWISYPHRHNLAKYDAKNGPLLANLQQDSGWRFTDLRRHFNRHTDQDSKSAIEGFLKFLSSAQADFLKNVKTGTLSSCETALALMGLITHTWQDYYAHAVIHEKILIEGGSTNPPIGPPTYIPPTILLSFQRIFGHVTRRSPARPTTRLDNPVELSRAAGTRG